MGTEDIVCGNAAAAESAVHGLDLDRFAAQLVDRDAIADLSRLQLFEMRHQRVAQFGGRSESRLGLVFNRAHQYALHLR